MSTIPGDTEQTRPPRVPTSPPAHGLPTCKPLDAALRPCVRNTRLVHVVHRRLDQIEEVGSERVVEQRIDHGIAVRREHLRGHRSKANGGGTGRHERLERVEQPRGTDEVDHEDAPPVGDRR